MCSSCLGLRTVAKLTIKDYQEICSLLELEPKADRTATKFLSTLLTTKQVRRATKILEKIIRGKLVLLFGPGPSLEESLQQLEQTDCLKERGGVIVAVDGAAQALLTYGVSIDVLVTDLDGSFGLLQKNPLEGTIKVIHAHGDNISKLQALESLVQKEAVIGTTQTKETRKVKNFGGFTDGDRAAYLAANFQAKTIVLFGFDFGSTVGRYSKPDATTESFKASERKLVKFKIAKKLLERLPHLFPGIKIYNATIKGEPIPGISDITSEELLQLC